ncbi:MAG: hypothetical protein AB2776_21780 [Candidatus Thiodiazotropha endolucinida]
MGNTTPEMKPLSIQIEFTGQDLLYLESINIDNDLTQDYLRHLACVAAHLKTAAQDREGLETRNNAIGPIRHAVEIIERAKGVLHSDEYPEPLIKKLVEWADSLQKVAFKKTTNADKRYISPSENRALSAISELMISKEQKININPQRGETGAFLTISNIVFQASDLSTDIEALAKRAQRIINGKGELSNFSDGVFLYPPSLEYMHCKTEWSYSEGKHFIAVFSYQPLAA